MRPLTAIIVSIFISVAAGFLPAHATTIRPASSSEPSLETGDGILADFFGLGNLSRISDDLDGLWQASGTLDIFSIGKHARFVHNFGYLDSNDLFTSIIDRPDSQSTGSIDIPDQNNPFRFALATSNTPTWSSLASDNFGDDHLVSWLVTGGEFTGSYVLAWEDYMGLGDRDYNDLVMVISGVRLFDGVTGGGLDNVQVVPVPAALWLFGSGLLALVGLLRRR